MKLSDTFQDPELSIEAKFKLVKNNLIEYMLTTTGDQVLIYGIVAIKEKAVSDVVIKLKRKDEHIDILVSELEVLQNISTGDLTIKLK